MGDSGNTPDCINAVVKAVKANGGYAIAYPEVGQHLHGHAVTFSITAWTGDSPPLRNQCVDLWQVELFEKGWRAHQASPVTTQREV